MAQMKEQNKIPIKKKLNKMDASNLSDAKFKTLVIRMLKGHTGYFNSRKKNQAGMKFTLSEIEKNLQGTNSGGDKAENQINCLEPKGKDSIRTARRKKNTKKPTPQNQG